MTSDTRQRIASDITQRDAIKAAQAALGVLVDGVFGPASLAAVLELVERCKQLDTQPTGLTEGPRPT